MPMLQNSCGDSGACHSVSRGWQGGDIYAVISSIRKLMEEADTDPDLIDCIVDYLQGQGTITMASAVQNAPARFQALGHLQDTIEWQQFLEGMVSKEIVALQQQFYAVNGSWMSLDK